MFESVNACVWMPNPDGRECVCQWVNSDPKCKQSLLTHWPFAVLTEQMTTHREPGCHLDPYSIFIHFQGSLFYDLRWVQILQNYDANYTLVESLLVRKLVVAHQTKPFESSLYDPTWYDHPQWRAAIFATSCIKSLPCSYAQVHLLHSLFCPF